MELHISKKRVFGKTEYQILERPEIKGYSYNTYLLLMKHIEIFLNDARVISIYEENSTLKMLGIILLNMLQFNSYTMYIGEKQCGKIKPAFLFVLNPCFSFITPEETYTLRLHSNNICSVTCNSKQILKVITATGTEAAAYTYDAWGKLLTSTGDMADVNPLRYRGYYYDTETGLYYLQSRYYDPEVGRFINPDVFATTDVDGVLSANMFAYCENNPIRNSDFSGALFGLDPASAIIGAATGAITSLISGIASGDRGKDLIWDVALGAAAGATEGFISAAISAVAAATDAYKCYKDGVSIEGCVIVFASEFAASFVSRALFKKGFFGKGIWDDLGGAAFDLSVGFAVNLTASQISTNVAENLYMTEPSHGGKNSNQPVGNLAYIEPLQVMHYGGGTWRMATR